MKYSRYFKIVKRSLQFSRRFSDDIGKTFRDKGLSEENRYFIKKQEEELKKLRKQLELLTKHHSTIQKQLDETQKVITQISDGNNNKKEK